MKVKENKIHTLTAFTVEGTHEFPWDMLRYDRCWPSHEENIVNMNPMGRERLREPRQVKLIGLRYPTKGRWASFGWRVLEESVSLLRQD